MRRSWKRYQDLALKSKRIHRAMKVMVIPIVIGALETISKIAKAWYGRLTASHFWKCIVVSHPWYCSYLTESVVSVKVMLNETIRNNDF